MAEERRDISTADLVRGAEARDRAERMRPVSSGEFDNAPVGPDGQVIEPAVKNDSSRAMLFPNNEADRLRSEWTDIQAAFVDAPREAVQRADQLVAGTMKHIAEVFAGERRNLEQQWDRGDNVTTEDLRVALQRYRAFFDRLLSL